MAVLITDVGETYLQDYGYSLSSTWTFHLFSNNISWTHSIVLGSLTEATFGGYAAQSPGAWSVAAGSGGAETATAPQVTFLGNGGTAQNVYGWWVQEPGGIVIMGGGFAAGPYDVNSTSSGIQFTATQSDTY